MNKEEYTELHKLLAKLKYELVKILNSNSKFTDEIKVNLRAIDKVMDINCFNMSETNNNHIPRID